MLALEYPLFEVVIVNDGSTDSTLKKMTEYYELVEVPYAYIERIKNQTVPKTPQILQPEIQPTHRCRQRKMEEPKRMHPMRVSTLLLILILSARMWIAFWKSMLFYRCISPIISSEKQVIAVSGTMLMANGCVVKDGQIVDVRTPRTPIPLFQKPRITCVPT